MVGQLLIARGRENEAPPEWSRPPEPFDTGTCSGCGGSIEPDVVEFHVMTPVYEGDLVVVDYQAKGVRKLMINGRVFAWDDLSTAVAHADELLGPDHAPGIMREAISRFAHSSHDHDAPSGPIH